MVALGTVLMDTCGKKGVLKYPRISMILTGRYGSLQRTMTPHQALRNKQTLAGRQGVCLRLIEPPEALLNCPHLHSRWKAVSGTLVGRDPLRCYPQTVGTNEHQLMMQGMNDRYTDGVTEECLHQLQG